MLCTKIIIFCCPPEEVVVASSHDGGVCSNPATLELVKDTIIRIEGTQLGHQILVDCVGLDGLGLHVQIPNFDGEIVPAMMAQ